MTTKIEEELRKIAKEYNADKVTLTFTDKKTGVENCFKYEKEINKEKRK